MIAALRRTVERLFGVPPSTPATLDGPWRQNQGLGQCRLVERDLASPDDLAIAGGALYVSSGADVFELTEHRTTVSRRRVAHHAARVGALAATGDEIFTAVDGEGVLGVAIPRVSAMCVHEGTLYATEPPTDDWTRALFDGTRGGRLHAIDLATKEHRVLSSDLRFPMGVCVAGRELLVSEALDHELVALSLDASAARAPSPARSRSRSGPARPRVVLRDLPGLPGRVVAGRDGTYWLTLFALRNTLVELAVTDRDFCERMLRDVPREAWIAPALGELDHPSEAMQWGRVKQFGFEKAFAPARSYGLVAQLDASLRPRRTLHSRNGEKRHGVTGLALSSAGDGLYIAAQGHGKLLFHPFEEEPAHAPRP